MYGKGRSPPPSEPPELALGDPFSGLNDYDTGVKPGCYSGWNGLTDPFRGVDLFFKICVQQIQTSRRIAVDPAIVVIVAQSYAALPKFVLDKLARQQIVLRGLELLWRTTSTNKPALSALFVSCAYNAAGACRPMVLPNRPLWNAL